MTPRALMVRKLRDGFQIHVSNRPEPFKFKADVSIEDACFDLEMKGYDVSRIARSQAHKSVTRYAR